MRVGAVVFLGILILGFISCTGMSFVLQVPIQLGVGWLSFLGRVIPEITLQPRVLLETLGVVVVLAAGLHHFGSWLCAETGRTWSGARTTGVLLGVLLLFAMSIASAGLAHQIGWLFRSPEPLIESSWKWLDTRRSICSVAESSPNAAALFQTLWADPDYHTHDGFELLAADGSHGLKVAIVIDSLDTASTFMTCPEGEQLPIERLAPWLRDRDQQTP